MSYYILTEEAKTFGSRNVECVLNNSRRAEPETLKFRMTHIARNP